MAESFSVKAILSATDKGFTSTLKKALGTTESLGSKIKSGFAFGVLTGMGQQAFSMLTNGATELIGEVNQSSKAWQTFEGNMKNFGKNGKQIETVRKELQSFAETTVYSSSDMASTYAQLEAVGVGSMKKLSKGTSGLVKGFGGLAAAAEDPQQAMKSLSQQATQMAAKPKVAWEDFKIMLEQSPAGMAAVAKEMGISTEDLISKIQAGEVATEDFFAAIEKAGNSKGFQEMATKAKTVDQAFDGLKETLGNKLLPAFTVVSGFIIKGIDMISDKIGKIDGAALAEKVSAGIEAAKPYWEAFKDVLADVGGVLKTVGSFLAEHSDTIAKYAPLVLKLVLAYKAFSFIKSLVPGMSKFTGAITSLASKGIGAIAGKLFGVAAAETATGKASSMSATKVMTAAKSFLMMSAAVLLVSAGFALLAFSAVAVANAGGPAIAVLFGLIGAVALLGVGMVVMVKTLAPMGKKLTTVSTAMLTMGAAVLIVAAGFTLLAFAAISLANAGTPAILCMVGMVAAIALLAAGAAVLAPIFNANAIGLIAFGAAMLMVGAAVLLASAGIALLASQLPLIAQYGLQGALAITALGGALVVFGAGAALAGVGALALGAGLAVVAAGLALVGAAVLVTAAGVAALAAGSLVLAAGLLLTAAALTMIGATLLVVGAGTLVVVASFAALLGVSAGLSALLLVLTATMAALGLGATAGALAITAFGLAATASAVGVLALSVALKGVKSSMKSIASNAKTASSSLKNMVSAVKVVQSGLDGLGSKAKAAMNKLTSAFNSAASKAKSAGQKVGTGFTTGMQSGLNQAPSIAQAATARINALLTSAAARARASGLLLGTGFSTGVRSGMTSAVSAASSAVSQINARLRSGRSGAYSAGAFISIGFAQGMRSQLGSIQAAANAMVTAANKAIEAKAKIGSPSKVADKYGGWYGQGYINGIVSKVKEAWRAAEELVSFPTVQAPELALAYGGELSADYDYYRNAQYTIVVPFDIDGREFARAEATYMQDELDRKATRENRKHGKV